MHLRKQPFSVVSQDTGPEKTHKFHTKAPVLESFYILLAIAEIIVLSFSFFERGKLFFLSRSSRPEVYCRNGIHKNFLKFTGTHLCQSLFFNKIAEFTGVFLWMFEKFENPFLIEHSSDYSSDSFLYAWRKPFWSELSRLNYLKGGKLVTNNKYVDKWNHLAIS